MAWLLEVAKKAGLRSVAYFPASAAVLARSLSIPKLIEDGFIDEEGTLTEHMFRLSSEMPPMDPTQLSWNCLNDPKTSKLMFNLVSKNAEAAPNAELILCNTFHELEKSVFFYAPNILPVGPLLITGSRPHKTLGSFWVQETRCIEWLDKQQENSVIYVAFGSFTVISQHQYQELSLALELTGRPFLWVVRPDLTNVNDKQQQENISNIIQKEGDRGRIVNWCPQQQVLAHPSVACFVSHCGWNSTLEGVRHGVPFICWPYIADQFSNQTYIYDIWRVGLRMKTDENKIYLHEEIRSKLEELINDEKIKERSFLLKEMACKSLESGGSSFANLNNLIDLVKGV